MSSFRVQTASLSPRSALLSQTCRQCSRQNLRALDRKLCHLAELLAEHLPLCYLSREGRESALLYKLQFWRGLLSM